MNIIVSHIKRLIRKKVDKQFRKNLFLRDKWIVNKFGLPELSKSELQEINEVWPFVSATNDDLIWNRMYKMKYGFDPYYVSDYQVQPIYKALNPSVDVEFLKNKALIDVYCSEISFPKSYVKCMNGILYDSNGNLVTESDVEDLLRATGETDFIIKPSLNSGCGVGVCKFSIQTGTVFTLMNKAGNNFIIQECLKQCEFLSKLNESSINTCRITSLYIDGKFSLSVILKVGKKGAIIDNWNSSYWLKIDSQGNLANIAYDYKLREAKASDSGVTFDGLVYPDFSKLVNTIEYYHKKFFPTIGILGWDVFIDDNHTVRVIEVNPDFPEVKGTQFVIGTFFKEYRDTIVNRIINEKK